MDKKILIWNQILCGPLLTSILTVVYRGTLGCEPRDDRFKFIINSNIFIMIRLKKFYSLKDQKNIKIMFYVS